MVPDTQSYGEEAVGKSFNPSKNEKVDELKALYAQIIDILADFRGESRDEAALVASVAITEAQGAQMWAVKAITSQRG